MHFLGGCVFLAICCVASCFRPAAIRPRGPLVKALTATARVVDGDADAFERITLARRATKHFDGREVPDEVLKKVRLSSLTGTESNQSAYTRHSGVYFIETRRLVDPAGRLIVCSYHCIISSLEAS